MRVISVLKSEIFLPSPCFLKQKPGKSFSYVINQPPIPLKRPRVSGSRVYDSQKSQKLIMGISLKGQHEKYGEESLTGLLHFDINFFFMLPINRNKKALLLRQKYHNYKPDISNLIKMVEDVCVDSGIIQDDCIISSICSQKIYCPEDNPRTEFIITKI